MEQTAGSPMAFGHEIGHHAHGLFPGGVLVAEEPWQHAQAVARTAALGIKAILDGVAEGGAASNSFSQLASDMISHPEQVARLRAALLAYCRRDTLATIVVHRALARLAAGRKTRLG